MDQVRLIEGGVAVDDRGQLAFVNGFGFEGVKRFYAVSNHRQGFVRAWHGHKREAKYVHLAKGSAIVGAVRIDDWDKPSPKLPVERFVLSAAKPSALFIPAGFANGFMSLTSDALLYYFSTASIDESKGDDIRYAAHYWDPWQVEER